MACNNMTCTLNIKETVHRFNSNKIRRKLVS